jgi:hypothetical protein
MKKGFVSLKKFITFLKVTIGYDYPIILICISNDPSLSLKSHPSHAHTARSMLLVCHKNNAKVTKMMPKFNPISNISEGIFIEAIRYLVIL